MLRGSARVLGQEPGVRDSSPLNLVLSHELGSWFGTWCWRRDGRLIADQTAGWGLPWSTSVAQAIELDAQLIGVDTCGEKLEDGVKSPLRLGV